MSVSHGNIRWCTNLPQCLEPSTRDPAVKLAQSSQGLDELLQDTLKCISNEIFANPSFSNQSIELQQLVRTHGNTVPIIIPASQRLAVYPEYVVKELFHTRPDMILKGLTLYSHGKILLNRERWCVETLLHEVLHSVSVFGQRLDLLFPYERFIEGLTECYTQFLLARSYSRVHGRCLLTQDTYCTLTYPYETIIWCAIADVIGYQKLNRIYFWQGRNDWETLFQDLVLHVRKTYPRFQNILTAAGKLPIMARLHQECGKKIGDKYSQAYRKYSELFQTWQSVNVSWLLFHY